MSLNFNWGGTQRERWGGAATALLGALVFLGFSPLLLSREGEAKSLRIVGVVSQVEPARLVVRTSDGPEIALTPLEDFTGKLPVGSPVTVWYYVQDGVNVLARLDSPATSTSASASDTNSEASPGLPVIKKIILLPSSSIPDAEGIFDAIEKYLQSKFAWYVAPRVLAEEIRNRAGKSESTLEAISPETGEFDMSGYLAGQRNIITKLASETRVDAVLEVSIEEVTAKIKRMVASWDGMEEVVGGKGPRTIAKLAIVPGRGEVAASTVTLKLWDARGNLRWNTRRGLAVLGVQEGMEGKLRYRPLPEYLGDSSRVERWLTATFASLPAGLAPDRSMAKKPM